MYLVKAEANQIEKIVAMSVRAFETDVNAGGIKGDCPPEYDSIKWHQQMAREGHLYQAMIGNDLVGAAIVFPDETENSVYIGRIFIDSIYHRKGYGLRLMDCIEKHFPCAAEFHLDTPCWNERTNAFYRKLGYGWLSDGCCGRKEIKMLFKGIGRTFSTENDQQYETIGAFWDELAAKYGRVNLQGLGYGWKERSIEYVIGLINGEIGGADRTVTLPDTGWVTVQGRTADLGKIYEKIYQEGRLSFEIERFTDSGDCEIMYCRSTDRDK